jgi:hypothetical protein
MEGNEAQQTAWAEARKAVYYGSRLHFLRSYFDSSLSKEGIYRGPVFHRQQH